MSEDEKKKSLAVDAKTLLDSEMHEIMGGYSCEHSCLHSCSTGHSV